MKQGKVKWFSSPKGFGFVTCGQDYFVHFSAIVAEAGTYRTLNAGDEVSFDVIEGTKGPQAVNVRVVTPAQDQKENENVSN